MCREYKFLGTWRHYETVVNTPSYHYTVDEHVQAAAINCFWRVMNSRRGRCLVSVILAPFTDLLLDRRSSRLLNFFFFFFSPVRHSPGGCRRWGWMVSDLHSSLLCTNSFVICIHEPLSLMSAVTLSIHLFRCLPLLRLPSIFVCSVSSWTIYMLSHVLAN